MAAKKPVKKTAETQTEAGMNPADRKWIEAVDRELASLLRNPYDAEILGNAWFEDQTKPVPNSELLEFFTMEFLWGFGKYARFLEAAEKGAAAAVCQYLLELGKMSPAVRLETVSFAAARRKILALFGHTSNDLHWWPAIMSLDADLPKLPQIALGQRRLTRFLVEAMTLRAVFQSDGPRLDGLASAVRIASGASDLKPTQAQSIAFQMLRWQPFLAQELGRDPTKTELREFLKDFYPDISDHPATWQSAHKLIGLKVATARSRKIDSAQISKLVRKARKVGLKIDRQRSWKQLSLTRKTFSL